MPFSRPISEFASVEKWAEGLRRQWGGDPLREEPEKLQHLEEFCEFLSKDPDDAIGYCFLRKRGSGDKFASAKRRQEIAKQVRIFRDQSGRVGLEGRRLVSNVLSFFIHGGVLIDPAMV